MRPNRVLRIAPIFLFCLLATNVKAEDEFDRAPIEYSSSTPGNCISRLQSRINRSELELSREDERGYLPAVLKA